MIEAGLIQLTQFIEHPPTKAWQPLTDPTLIAKWWTAGDVRPVVEHRGFDIDITVWKDSIPGLG